MATTVPELTARAATTSRPPTTPAALSDHGVLTLCDGLRCAFQETITMAAVPVTATETTINRMVAHIDFHPSVLTRATSAGRVTKPAIRTMRTPAAAATCTVPMATSGIR